MNQKQKIILLAVATVVLGMLVYPPLRWEGRGGIAVTMGYHWISSHCPRAQTHIPESNLSSEGLVEQMTRERARGQLCSATVDIGLLITQWIAVLIVGGIAYFVLKNS